MNTIATYSHQPWEQGKACRAKSPAQSQRYLGHPGKMRRLSGRFRIFSAISAPEPSGIICLDRPPAPGVLPN
jgi:hypothetical protein